MAQAKIQRTDAFSSTVTAQFNILGLLELNERKSQVTGPVPIPFTSDTGAVLANLTGQVREFTGSFILITRTDDYTNGTGSPSAYDPDEQRAWLQDNVFTANGKHILNDEEGNQYSGRLTEVAIQKAGDDPLKYDVTFRLVRGRVVGL